MSDLDGAASLAEVRANFDFAGKTALVTGASKGIGRECAKRLAAAGCAVAATARNQDELDSLASEIIQADGRCEIRVCDLTDADEIPRMVVELREKIGPFSLLVNNAGISTPESFMGATVEHWDATMAVNLRAPFVVSQAVLPDMIESGHGAIVNVGSVSGVVGHVDHAAYCASKSGLHGLSRVMALELGPMGIRVNCVAPTVILTPMGEAVWGDPSVGEPMRAKIPLGKFGVPGDVADAVMFLLSDSASMIHGEVLMLDGGYCVQ